jgi:transcriptional regulator with XRE-family HTH domain
MSQEEGVLKKMEGWRKRSTSPLNCGAQVQQEREAKGWTQEQLAREIGATVSEIQNWENNLSYPDVIFRKKLSDLFNKDICG